jgi:threonine dehydratase
MFDEPPSGELELPTIEDVRQAASRIGGLVHHTPTATSEQLDAASGATVVLKCEQFQKVGAFKARGAANAVWSLDDDTASRGVAAHSSGNHAQALAWAARSRGIDATVVMPRGTPRIKVDAVEGYGARVVWCEPNLPAREAAVARLVAETGATEIHPYDDPKVIAGAATATAELVADHPDLDLVLTPVGGGGLLSGASLVVGERELWGAEPTGADDAARSLAAGELIPQLAPDTIADGLLTSLSPRTFALLSAKVTRIATVTDDEIRAAMVFLWTRLKLVVEPSGAVGVAVVLRGDAAGRRVGVVLSGGNVDFPLDG